MGKLLTVLGVIALAVFAVAMFWSGGPRAEHGWAALPAEMDGMFHLDVRALAATPLVDEAIARNGDPASSSDAWRELADATGFDPWTDLESISAGGIGEPDDPASAVYAIVRGEFDHDRWADFLATKISLERDVIDGRRVWYVRVPTDAAAWRGTVTWLDERTAAVASDDHLAAMLAALAGHGPRIGGTALGSSFATLDGQLRVAAIVPAEFRDRIAGGAGANPALAMAGPLRSLQSILFDLDVDSGLSLELGLTAGSEEDGRQLYDMVNGYVTLGKMFAAQNPEAAAALESLALTQEGPRVSLTLAVTGEQIWNAVEAAEAGGPPAFVGG